MSIKSILKTLIAFCIIASPFCFVGDAGFAQRMRLSAEDRVKRLTEQLDLTKTQADSVRKIFDLSDKERSMLFEGRGDNREAIRDSMQKIMRKYDAMIESLLTGGQRAAYDKVKMERPRMMGPRGDRLRPQK